MACMKDRNIQIVGWKTKTTLEWV